MRNIFLLAILAIFISCGTSEPQTSKQEYEPTISYDISNQQINDFEEDKDGHIWIATFRGLNKYISTPMLRAAFPTVRSMIFSGIQKGSYGLPPSTDCADTPIRTHSRK